MQETSTSPTPILQFRQDIEAQFRRHIREALAVALAEELAAALGSGRHQRTDRRCGYRNGTVERTITTPDGTRTVTVPRGRVADTAGVTTEFHSQLLPRYARRTREIDDAILGCYLGGINSRRNPNRIEAVARRAPPLEECRVADRRPAERALHPLGRVADLSAAR